jgi:hypothetical protein
MKPRSRVSKKKRDVWLLQHIPYRVRAAVCYAEFIPMPKVPMDTLHGRCVNHAVHQGRLIAIRWLIEFIGIKMSRTGKVTRSTAVTPNAGKDFGITNLPGGRRFGCRRKGARKLARAWKGCSQAVSHPTFDTRHPKVDGIPILEVVQIIFEWLESTLYQPNKLSLRTII